MKIKSLLVMPGKEVQKVKIPANIKFIKSLLGDDLQKIRINENTIIYISKQTDYTEYNRLFDGYILIGTFLIVSIKNNKNILYFKKKYDKIIENRRDIYGTKQTKKIRKRGSNE